MIRKQLNNKTGPLVLFFLWVFVQVAAYFHFGIMESVDSERYIGIASAIKLGEWPQNEDFLYSAYSLMIALPMLLGLNAIWVVLLQVAMSGLALVGIYRITLSLSKNAFTAFIACIFYLLWFKFHQWSLIVYSDSLFTSSVIISVSVLWCARSKSEFICASILIIFSGLIRPAGIGFLISILGYALYDTAPLVNRSKILKVATVAASLVVSLSVLNELLRDFITSFLESYRNAEIIYPLITLGVERPENLQFFAESKQPIIQLTMFIVNNPSYMLKISLLKGILFVAHVKPYYSLGHNFFILSILCPAYFFAFRGFRILPWSKLTVFTVTFISFQIATIALTSENWDGRFLLPVLPWVFIYASVGITHVLKLYTERCPAIFRKIKSIVSN